MNSNMDYIAFAILAFASWGVYRLSVCRPSLNCYRVHSGIVLTTLGAITGATIACAILLTREYSTRAEQTLTVLVREYARQTELLGHEVVVCQVLKSGSGSGHHEAERVVLAEAQATYLQIIDRQKEWQAINPIIADVYTYVPKDGEYVFIVDSESDYNADGDYLDDREERTDPGSVSDGDSTPHRIEIRNRIMAGEAVVDIIPFVDQWSDAYGWVSAEAPLRNKQGSVEAVLGIDVPASSWFGGILRARGCAFAAGFFANCVILLSFFRTAQSRHQTRDRKDFLTRVSHELKTPISCIIQIARRLEEQTDVAVQGPSSFVELCRQAKKLERRVADLVEFASLRQHGVTVKREGFYVRNRIQQAVNSCRYQAEAKGLELSCDIDEGIPNRLVGDAMLIEQVMENLVGNAIKFTEQGSVDVIVSCEAADDRTARVTFEVHDTGPGIPKRDQQRILLPFEQACESHQMSHKGLGLGLYISQAIVTAMGGRLELRNTESGACVSFALTIRVDAGVADHRTEAKEQVLCEGIRLLIAEDDPLFRELIVEQAESRGFLVETAEDGEEAVAICGRCQIDAAILDLGMPKLDGNGAARQILATSEEGCRKLVVALTADVSRETFEEARSAGFAEVFSKGTDLDEIFHLIVKAVCAEPVDEDLHDPAESSTLRHASTLDLSYFRGNSRRAARYAEGLGDGLVHSLQRELEDGDFDRATESAHTLSGRLCVFGESEEAFRLVCKIRVLVKSREFEKAQNVCETLISEVERLQNRVMKLIGLGAKE